MAFKKHMLLGYKLDGFLPALNAEGFTYILTVRMVSWWGLSDRVVIMKVEVPYSISAKDFYEPKLNVWSTAP